jgi:hypothetical protein
MSQHVLLFFHHQVKLKSLSFLEIGGQNGFVDYEGSQKEFDQNYAREIEPKLKWLLQFAEEGNNPMAAFSTSFLEALKARDVYVLDALKAAVTDNKIGLVGTTAYQSFGYLAAPHLLLHEIKSHRESLLHYFDKRASLFCNTAALYDDTVAQMVVTHGFDYCVAPANSWHLSGKEEDIVYRANIKNPVWLVLTDSKNKDILSFHPANAYGTSYKQLFLHEVPSAELPVIKYLEKLPKKDLKPYPVSMPLSVTSWAKPIGEYMHDPLQKALLKQIKLLYNKYESTLYEEDLKTLLFMCQPEHLASIHQLNEEEGYSRFISSMNILTAIGLKYS